MPSLLEQLGNEQAMLMHLAGELPPEDAAELETMLGADARLAREAKELREARDYVYAAMGRMDSVEAPPTPQMMAIRAVRRQMNLKRIDPSLIGDADAAKKTALRYPWWTYPMATAAAVLLAFLVWWGNSDYSPQWLGQDNQTALNVNDLPTGQFGLERSRMRRGPTEMDPALRAAYMEARQKWLADWLTASFAGDDKAAEASDSTLAQAERQVAMLGRTEQQFPLPQPMESNQ